MSHGMAPTFRHRRRAVRLIQAAALVIAALAGSAAALAASSPTGRWP